MRPDARQADARVRRAAERGEFPDLGPPVPAGRSDSLTCPNLASYTVLQPATWRGVFLFGTFTIQPTIADQGFLNAEGRRFGPEWRNGSAADL